VARYEFRIWGVDLEAVAGHLEELGTPAAIWSSREIYLLVPGFLDTNPKIRDDTLDVKVLQRVVDGFEQWEPRLKCTFPVPAAVLESELFPLLGLDPPPLGLTQYEPSNFVADVVQPHPKLDAVEVTKARRIYDLGPSIGEAAEVTIAGVRLTTVAIESEDLNSLRAMRDRLGLAARDNQSYPRAIRSVLARTDD
jgi:hypothetical protein